CSISPTDRGISDKIYGYSLKSEALIKDATSEKRTFRWSEVITDWDFTPGERLVVFEVLRKDPGNDFRPIAYTFGNTRDLRPGSFGAARVYYKVGQKDIITDNKNECSDIPPDFIFGDIYYSVRAIVHPVIEKSTINDTLIFSFSKDIGTSIYGNTLVYAKQQVGNIGGIFINNGDDYTSTNDVMVTFKYRDGSNWWYTKFRFLSSNVEEGLNDDEVKNNLKNLQVPWVDISKANPSRATENAVYACSLSMDKGRKKWVYMQAILNNETDTVIKKDFIYQAEWFADIFVLNEDRTSLIKTRRTLNKLGRAMTINIATGLSIPFELSIPSDTTFSDTFWIWAVSRKNWTDLRDTKGAIAASSIDDDYGLLETQPIMYVLKPGQRTFEGIYAIPNTFLIKTPKVTGLDPGNRDENIRFNTPWKVVPDNADPKAAGKEFGWIGYSAHKSTSTGGTRTNDEFVVETANIPKTLMEIDPRYYRDGSISANNETYIGYKEFLLVARLKGKYFKDDRYILSDHWNFQPKAYDTRTLVVWDKIPPAVNFSSGYEPLARCYAPLWDTAGSLLSDLSIVDNIFMICLAENSSLDGKTIGRRSCYDGAGGRIVSVTLKFNRAEYWDNIWSYEPYYHPKFYKDEGHTQEVESIEWLKYDEEYFLKNAPVGMESHYLDDVDRSILLNFGWNDIDARAWETGEYFYWVETEDEFGNYGFAPSYSKQNYNFRRFFINTGL
ncbi:MAG: hypothetical protein ABIA63_09425, partial [bacterium]